MIPRRIPLSAWIGMTGVVAFAGLAILAPVIAPYGLVGLQAAVGEIFHLQRASFFLQKPAQHITQHQCIGWEFEIHKHRPVSAKLTRQASISLLL